MGRPKPPMNNIRVDGELAYMDLTDRRGNVTATAILDAADVPKVVAFGHRWSAKKRSDSQRIDVVCSYGGETTVLSRYLLDAPRGLEVDHANREPLDNRRENLRLATHAENQQNKGLQRRSSTKTRNVNLDKKTGKYRVRLSVNRKRIDIGYFDTIESATEAAECARRKHMPFHRETTRS